VLSERECPPDPWLSDWVTVVRCCGEGERPSRTRGRLELDSPAAEEQALGTELCKSTGSVGDGLPAGGAQALHHRRTSS